MEEKIPPDLDPASGRPSRGGDAARSNLWGGGKRDEEVNGLVALESLNRNAVPEVEAENWGSEGADAVNAGVVEELGKVNTFELLLNPVLLKLKACPNGASKLEFAELEPKVTGALTELAIVMRCPDELTGDKLFIVDGVGGVGGLEIEGGVNKGVGFDLNSVGCCKGESKVLIFFVDSSIPSFVVEVLLQ